MRDAVERGIEVISEASRHLPEELKAQYSGVPWRSVAGIGNIIRHGCDVVNDQALWNTIEQSLPPLRAAVEALIARLERG